VDNYISLDYWGEVAGLRRLRDEYSEDYAEILELIEEGILTTSAESPVN
jgi:hypothetical protein